MSPHRRRKGIDQKSLHSSLCVLDSFFGIHAQPKGQSFAHRHPGGESESRGVVKKEGHCCIMQEAAAVGKAGEKRELEAQDTMQETSQWNFRSKRRRPASGIPAVTSPPTPARVPGLLERADGNGNLAEVAPLACLPPCGAACQAALVHHTAQPGHSCSGIYISCLRLPPLESLQGLL